MKDVCNLKLNAFNKDWNLILWKDRYPSNSFPSVFLIVAETGEIFSVLSVNVGSRPPENCFWAKTWGENEHLREKLLETGLFEDTGVRTPTGFVEAELWKWKEVEEDEA